MRSHQDPYFSDLCDRVGRDKITDDDEHWLRSRVIPCESEYNNENFKSGRLLILVTTNMKKDFVNQQKLNDLLPNQK